MKVTYYYSACILIETPDMSLLCDPWFTEGAYDGSWYHFPPFSKALQKLPKVDYIWISHIHPDHYDPKFLQEYLKKYPKTKVLISDFKENILDWEMNHHDIPHQIVKNLNVGKTKIACFPNDAIPDDVDSAIAVKYENQSVVNTNDNFYSSNHIKRIKKFCPQPDVLFTGYMGAGPYPQTYFNDKKMLVKKAREKKENFFGRYKKMVETINPKKVIPFAGQYILGGKLRKLNAYRGIPDATEILSFDSKAVVLDTGGSINIETGVTLKSRTKPYVGLEKYAETLKNEKMYYEKFFSPDMDFRFDGLLPKAYAQARKHSVCTTDYYFCIKLDENWFYMNANKKKNECGFVKDVKKFSPRSEIIIDKRCLFGLITSIFHWNNAQIGSHYMTNRLPDTFHRPAEIFLHFFQI